MEDRISNQARLESEIKDCKELVDNPRALHDVLVKVSESKGEPMMGRQGPVIELSDESLEEEEPEVIFAEEDE